MKADATKTKETCETLIEGRLRNRLADINPDFRSMDVPELRAFCEEFTNDLPDDLIYAGPNKDEPYYKSILEYADSPAEALLDEDTEQELWADFAEETHRDHSMERVLSIEFFKTVKILLSTGGPEDYFEVYFDDDVILGGRYFYKDWFDGASRAISAAEAEDVIEGLGVYLEGVH